MTQHNYNLIVRPQSIILCILHYCNYNHGSVLLSSGNTLTDVFYIIFPVLAPTHDSSYKTILSGLKLEIIGY